MMKSVPDIIPVAVWRCPGERAVCFQTGLLNINLESDRRPEEQRTRVPVPIFETKVGVQSCCNHSGVKLVIHTMKT